MRCYNTLACYKFKCLIKNITLLANTDLDKKPNAN